MDGYVALGNVNKHTYGQFLYWEYSHTGIFLQDCISFRGAVCKGLPPYPLYHHTYHVISVCDNDDDNDIDDYDNDGLEDKEEDAISISSTESLIYLCKMKFPTSTRS